MSRSPKSKNRRSRSRSKSDPASVRVVESCQAFHRRTERDRSLDGRVVWFDVAGSDEPWFAYHERAKSGESTLLLCRGIDAYTELTRLAGGGSRPNFKTPPLFVRPAKWADSPKPVQTLFERAGEPRQGGERVVAPVAYDGPHPRPLRGEELRMTAAIARALSEVDPVRAADATQASVLDNEILRVGVDANGRTDDPQRVDLPDRFEPYEPADEELPAPTLEVSAETLPRLPHIIGIEWSAAPIHTPTGTEWLRVAGLFSGRDPEPVACALVDPADASDVGAFLVESFSGRNRFDVVGLPKGLASANENLLRALQPSLEKLEVATKPSDDDSEIERVRHLRRRRRALFEERLREPIRDLEWTLLERTVLDVEFHRARANEAEFEGARVRFVESLGDARRLADGLADAFSEWVISDPSFDPKMMGSTPARDAIVASLRAPRLALVTLDQVRPGVGLRRDELEIEFTERPNGPRERARLRRPTDTERADRVQVLRIHDYAPVLRASPVTPALEGEDAARLTEAVGSLESMRSERPEERHRAVLELSKFWGL